MKLPEIVGIAGTNASGKDTLGELRARLQHAKLASLSDILRHELDKEGIAHERENLRALSDRWQREYGPGILSTKTIELYQEEKAAEGYEGLTITSVRRPSEASKIKAAGGLIIWVDADRRLRYERAQQRNMGRPTDQKTFEEFVAEEEVELHPVNPDETSINMAAVREMADIAITNEFPSVKVYEQYLIKEFELG